jgi:hypothetical protein
MKATEEQFQLKVLDLFLNIQTSSIFICAADTYECLFPGTIKQP